MASISTANIGDDQAHPVLLVGVQDNGEFKLHEEGLSIFRKCKGPLGIVAVAGLYRFILLLITFEILNHWHHSEFGIFIG